mgnify:CR=1 FL=1
MRTSDLPALAIANVKLGLRPENVLVNASDEAGVLWLDSELSHIEYMGSELFAYFKVGATTITSLDFTAGGDDDAARGPPGRGTPIASSSRASSRASFRSR